MKHRRPPRPSKQTSARGLESELRVIEACRLKARPSWLRRTRRATRIEDRSGIDVVVETDVGTMLIQVKSSDFGKERFRPRRFLGISIVVVRAADTPEGLLGKVVDALSDLRAERLKVQEAMRQASAKAGGKGRPSSGR